jgi:myosin heavy subunit
MDPELFNYTGQSGVIHIDGVSDEKEYDDMINSMNILKFSKETQASVFAIVAGVLHFGNTKFTVEQKAMQEDGCAIENPEVVKHACEIWGVDYDTVSRSLTSKIIGTRTLTVVPYTTLQATDARDAMVKRVYSGLFQHMVDNINSVLSASGVPRHKFIGVLDIFGFESFEVNSFEQLCINYCNEKLQFHFNEHIFRLESALYQTEGITISSTSFADNQPTLDLLDLKVTGIFSMCDEEINVPRGSDDGMLQKILQKHGGKHPNLIRPKGKDCKDNLKCFGINHYAGPVFYNVSNFLDKNKDQVHVDILSALKTSSDPLMKVMFAEKEEAVSAAPSRGRGGGKKASKTLGAQFKTQLNDLMDTLNLTNPHFVRCMKSNDEKCGNIFAAGRMQDQLRYAGLVEVCRIRKLGYPVRIEKQSFFRKFKCIYPNAKSLDELVKALVDNGELKTEDWALGTTKVFMRTGQSVSLELRREVSFAIVAVKVQSTIRRFLAKRKIAYFMKLIQKLKDGISSRDEATLTLAIDMIFELPNGGAHMKVVKDAKTLQMRLREESRIKTLLQNAISSRDMSSLRSAIQAAEAMSPPVSTPLIEEARAVLHRLDSENKVKTELTTAASNTGAGARDKTKAALMSLIQKAKDMGMDCNETRQAIAILTRFDDEDKAVADLKKAISDRHFDSLHAAIQKLEAMGMDVPEIATAKQLKEAMIKEHLAVKAISMAIEARELSSLVTALSKASAIGVKATAPEFVEGTKLKAILENEKTCIAALEAATESRDLSRITMAVAEATKLGLSRSSCSALEDCLDMEDQLKKEAEVNALLTAAISKDDADSLSHALAEASRIGLTGPLVETARSKNKAHGARNETLDRLSFMASGDMLEDLRAAISEADKMGLRDTPEGVAAAAKLARLEEETKLVTDLKKLTASANASNIQALSKALGQCMRMGIQTKYDVEVKAAKSKVDGFKAEADFAIHVETAMSGDDMEALVACIATAKASGVNTSFGEKKIVELNSRREISQQLAPALASKNTEVVLALLAKAQTLGFSNDIVDDAKSFASRAQAEKELYADLEQATVEYDLKNLDNALRRAVELGLRTPPVEKAQTFRAELEVIDAAVREVTAACQVVVVKLETGISEADVVPVIGAIAKVRALNPPADWSPLVSADATLDTYRAHISTGIELKAALKSNDRTKLRAVLSKAEDLDMRTEDVRLAKESLKGTVTEREVVEEQDYEDAEKARELKKDEARQARFDLKNFSGLRTANDFAKGAILNKQSVKDKFLIWQGTVVSKSLMDLPKDLSKISIQLHKDLLGYMGDKHMPFPAMLAQDLLRKGYEIIGVRDEIFLQIIKQLSTNPRAESVAKGWQLMCMCVSTFPPSPDFENYLLHYILNKLEKGRGAVVDYARYCLRTLEGMLSSGESSGFVPSVEEIQAYKDRPPILATIELVDGQLITEDLPVTPDLNVGKVLEICSGWLDLKDHRANTMGIFVYDLGEIGDSNSKEADPYANAPYKDLIRTPRPLRNEDFMGDVIVQKARQRRKFKFVIKKKIFVPQHYARGDDSYYERLVYLQAEDETIIQGNIPIDDVDTVTELASMSMTVAFGEDMPDSVDGLLNEGMLDFFPPAWREEKSPEEWAAAMLANRDRMVGMDTENLQAEFVSIVQENPLYGTHWFYVHKVVNTPTDKTPRIVKELPWDILLGFNSEGMHMYTFDRVLIHSFAFGEIYRWGGSSSQFSLIIWDSEIKESFELIVTTAQAADMAAIILDHIRTIMSLDEGA